jgi:rRNA maturation RNase YbeY
MISFNYETTFSLEHEARLTEWLKDVIKSEGFKYDAINYVFCDDDYLHKLNVEFLKHDTLTDIISFDYSVGKIIQGDIFISVDRVKENALDFDVSFNQEIHRVIVHGILHYCGYKDKSEEDTKRMRAKEDFYLNRLVELS